MRSLRILIGGFVVVVALYFIVGEHLAGASEASYINARLTTIKAPIAGKLKLVDRTLGSTVRDGETLGWISNPLVDESRLNDLVLEQDAATALVTRLTGELAAIDDAHKDLDARSQDYANERVKQLEAELKAADAKLKAAEARVDVHTGKVERARSLSKRGVTSNATLEEAEGDKSVAERSVDQMRSEQHVLEVRVAAARRGLFLGNSDNDAPYSEQQAEALKLRKHETEAQLEEAKEKVAFLKKRIDEEKRLIAKEREAKLVANVNGQLWELLAANGEHVERGQDVARLLDCDSSIVTASVTESVYNKLAVGDTVRFRLNGRTKVFTGTISRLAGIGASGVYRNLAVSHTDRDTRRFDVAIMVPELRADPELGCAIGRTGRAFFDGPSFDWAKTVVATLSP